jgi:hypothetical protein
MIMVEEAETPADLGKSKEKKVRLGIQHVMRYGIQIVTHLGQGIQRLSILRKELIRKDKKKTLEVDIENTGEHWLVPEVAVELFDSKGIKAGHFKGRKMRIYPGTSIRQSIDLSGIAPDFYKGLIIIDNGDENIFGARTELQL